MSNYLKKSVIAITAIPILTIIAIISVIGGGAVKVRAAATTSTAVITAYEQSNIWDDLQGAKVDGAGIDLTVYNFDEKKNVQVLTFVEFCYSYRKDKQRDFGLYVYVYNPRGYDLTKYPDSQNIKMRYGGNSSASFETYKLQYLNRSEKAGTEGLFYKFKLALSEQERTAILAGVNSAGRIYEISEIELCGTGKDLTAYDVTNKYTYKGYATGYGPASAASDSLSSESEELMSLKLDVQSATYRTENTNGKPYTQDMLHSVYFSIPNKILNDYGGLTAVHARWLNAKTSPIFVTGNNDVYKDIIEQIEIYGGELKGHTEYSLLVNASDKSTHIAGLDQYKYEADRAYNVDGVGWHCDKAINKQYYGIEPETERRNSLYYAFLADTGNADEYELKGGKIIEYLKYYTEKISAEAPPVTGGGSEGSSGGGGGGGGADGRSTGSLVAGKYNPVLFESYDKEYTDKNIKADDKYTLTNTKLSQSFWEWVLGKPGTQVEYSKTFDNIEAIHAVTSDDFRNTEAMTCKRLYIDESYYSEFKAYYDRATKANETVFLFRYYQSEYESKEVTEFERRNDVNGFMQVHIVGGDVAIKKLDTNAYMAQEAINLDFDVIDVTCTKGNVTTVIANIASPKDIAPNVTPPLVTTPDEEEFDFWEWLAELLHVNVKTAKIIFWCVVGAIALAIVIGILSPFLPGLRLVLKYIAKAILKIFEYLFIGIGWLILLPFNIVSAIFVSIKNKFARRKQSKENIRQEKELYKEQMVIERYQNRLDRRELKYQSKLDEKDAAKASKKIQKQKARQRRKTKNKRNAKKK